jgi:hypothetical protein
MGPLSGKERREDAALLAKQQREMEAHRAKLAREQELHQIKLKGEAAKYGVAPPAAPKMSTRDEVLAIQAAMPKAPLAAAPQPGSTDTVPAMLTAGEAVIPVAAAQNPANKPIIARLVQEGRDAGAAVKGLMQHFLGEAAPRSIVDRKANIDKAERAATQGFEDGTVSVTKSNKGWGAVDLDSAYKKPQEYFNPVNTAKRVGNFFGFEEGTTAVPFPLARSRKSK